MSRRRATYHHGDLARALVNAAGALLETRGPEAVTVRAAAAAAGVTVAAPYRHFADKDELLAAVATRGFEALAAAVREAAQGARSPKAAARQGAEAWLGFAATHRAVYALMFGARGTQALEVAAAAPGAALAAAAGGAAAELAALVHGLASLEARGALGGADPRVTLAAALARLPGGAP